MSTVMCIQPCKFIDRMDSKDIISYGYRCYDDCGSCYSNLWKEEDLNMSSIKIFEKVWKERKDDVDLDVTLDFIVDTKGEIYVGDDLLDWENIKDIVS